MKSTLVNKINIFLAAALLLCSPILAKGNNKESTKEQPKSRNFIAFDDAVYNTSPDKRIGAKILVDTNIVGPSIAAMTHLTYLPGAHVESHRHVYVTEIIYVLEGNLTVRIGTETKILGKDSTAFVPPKTFHELMNERGITDETLDIVRRCGIDLEAEEKRFNATAEAKAQAEEIAKQQELKNKEPEEIKGPAPLTVPGSPTTVKLGEVKMEQEEESSKKKELLLNLKPTSEKEK